MKRKRTRRNFLASFKELSVAPELLALILLPFAMVAAAIWELIRHP